jgi:hypothetical protein
MVALGDSAPACSPDQCSLSVITSRPGTRSVDRRSTQPVPLVASQPISARRVGGGLDGSGSGRGPVARPAAVSWS